MCTGTVSIALGGGKTARSPFRVRRGNADETYLDVTRRQLRALEHGRAVFTTTLRLGPEVRTLSVALSVLFEVP
jgi:hypothetical protein